MNVFYGLVGCTAVVRKEVENNMAIDDVRAAVKKQKMQGEKMSNRLKAQFEEYYAEGVKTGKVPLEFAGAKGKEVLENFYQFGTVIFALELLESSMGAAHKKGGDVA